MKDTAPPLTFMLLVGMIFGFIFNDLLMLLKPEHVALVLAGCVLFVLMHAGIVKCLRFFFKSLRSHPEFGLARSLASVLSFAFGTLIGSEQVRPFFVWLGTLVQ
ncbi:hypothetical protein A3C89_01135 [Candidatus Kaiserbacteria bacterium RIFCSPHIGHO2_02_FULL_50_50]|uniref:Uncharacterized protein n=1 Tax=Candidatus Kaiserbacteria bacterium RIFCSPHIGHO2_02_FULL_50_50 TaxID=1798492 RepID=A0A1F6DDU4_9BACT|nr:MAG: hypothetical protein A3C89_01135 [Candidatus Kaiserbacteria bacterium RIFCSPHIGHO2_02_FULL_50_50]OGG88726.1 MAG: hypothetical protein A3G62_00535 [Candidatus Kaiserbacteria bacterium RIFCSPLOWO2_12_FULL_50_10]